MVISASICKYNIICLAIGLAEYRTCFITMVCVLDIIYGLFILILAAMFFTEEICLMTIVV